ncbi:MAG: hypothetical protein U0166_07080 [Acidobacteriota bacterium]
MLTLFRITSVVNGLAMIATGLYGVFAPAAAMQLMTGLDHRWDAETMSLMRMHNGADFGLGVGFMLVAWRPRASLAALVLCLFANVAHGVVHLIDEAQGQHHIENIGPIGILLVFSVLIAALYPWREGIARYSAA